MVATNDPLGPMLKWSMTRGLYEHAFPVVALVLSFHANTPH